MAIGMLNVAACCILCVTPHPTSPVTLGTHLSGWSRQAGENQK
eukprot:CAMPEP_0195143200 /NCGR_PEP_ID=MMETSP0448-20130528/165954_1 /TAXON_ID=66468 /ORGANISM="Heterocapsa triquestra, Strain CCMP 448" /LENGTH=42 /DNA_ID= /DNA_START= /DNA_END= /DNA_ORIENTATION=